MFMCSVDIHDWLSIDTLSRYPQSTSWLVLNQHPDWNSVDNQSTLHQQLVYSRPSANQGVDGELTESQWRVSIKDIDQHYKSKNYVYLHLKKRHSKKHTNIPMPMLFYTVFIEVLCCMNLVSVSLCFQNIYKFW